MDMLDRISSSSHMSASGYSGIARLETSVDFAGIVNGPLGDVYSFSDMTSPACTLVRCNSPVAGIDPLLTPVTQLCDGTGAGTSGASTL